MTKWNAVPSRAVQTSTRSLPVGSNVGSVACADVDNDTDLYVLASSTSQLLLFPSGMLASVAYIVPSVEMV